MGCKCKNKNKEFHPCQNGGKCKCGGKCKKKNKVVENDNNFLNAAGQYDEHKFNAAGSLEDFKSDKYDKKKMIGYAISAVILIGLSYMIYKKLRKIKN